MARVYLFVFFSQRRYTSSIVIYKHEMYTPHASHTYTYARTE